MLWMWLGFGAFLVAMLAFDLGVLHRNAHAVFVRESLGATGGWVALAMLFSVFVYCGYRNHWLRLGMSVDHADDWFNDGRSAIIKYLYGYMIELSLSMDNIFVMVLLIEFFGVPAMHQHRLLFWGILGAMVLRGVMIAAGVGLVMRFHWMLPLFGVFLVAVAGKMLFIHAKRTDLAENWVVRLARRFLPVTSSFDDGHFLTIAAGRRMLTPLALTLVVVEVMDAMFATDSVPAIFAVTADPFLVFTSNAFAILGLRSLYFALAGLARKLAYLNVSLGLILALIGVKMLTARWLKQSVGPNFNLVMLGLVALILVGGAVISLAMDRKSRSSTACRSAARVNLAGPIQDYSKDENDITPSHPDCRAEPETRPSHCVDT
jgi:tellurite resistance protein TerC